MIINKTTKAFMSRSDIPNENWLDDDNYFVVADGSELYNKILKSNGNFDFILDEAGNLIDISYAEVDQDELNLDFDYRLSCLELGVN